MTIRRAFNATCLAAFSLAAPNMAHANLITNGSFEQTLVGSYGQTAVLGPTALAGWNILSPGGTSRSSVVNSNLTGTALVLGAIWPGAQEGAQYLYLNVWGKNDNIATQTLSLASGSYSLSFYLNGLVNGIGSTLDYSPSVNVSVIGASGSPLAATTAYGTDNRGWTKVNYDFSVATEGAFALSFATPSNPVLPTGQPFNFITIDNVELNAVTSPIPEPSTAAMVLAGLGLIGGAARRRKQI